MVEDSGGQGGAAAQPLTDGGDWRSRRGGEQPGLHRRRQSGEVDGADPVQFVPSADSYPVSVSPERVSRSQRGDAGETGPGRPGDVVGVVVLHPHAVGAVTIIAAYAEPGWCSA